MRKQENNFKLLSLREEQELSNKELILYYEKLREYALNRKLTNTTPGATTIAPKLKKITNKIALRVTDILSGCKTIKIFDGTENIPNEPVIFAHTHQGILDNFAWIPATPRHSITLHSSKVKKLLVLLQLNTGLVLVSKDKNNSQNRINAKLDMIKLLLQGHSISYFPESAWNLSPNKLHLPMSFGFLDIAKKANVAIIPVVDEFTYDSSTEIEKITKIHIRFGKPIHININDSLYDKLEEYSEQVSTIRWNLIEEKGIFLRSEIQDDEYTNYLKGNIRNLEMGGIDINVERENLWNYNSFFYKLHHINDIPLNKSGELEEMDYVKCLNLKPNYNNAFLYNKRLK